MKSEMNAAQWWRRYCDSLAFNAKLNLDEEVETNENFFIGKQWEGVAANGLPTPVFNFLKRVTLFTVGSITSDNLKLRASAMGAAGAPADTRLSDAVNAAFDALTENLRLGCLVREFMRNAAVDGDGCFHVYWDPEQETGLPVRGGIATEIVENTRVFFGNPNDRRVQKQPWIIIEKREQTELLRERARRMGVGDWERITPDNADRPETRSESFGGGRTTVLLCYSRSRETGQILCEECTRDRLLARRSTDLRFYPIVWLNWDYRQDNYHGQALISGLIPNQIFVNKLFALSMISLMTTAYPKVVYDATRVKKWSNQVGAAIGINGGDVNSVARIIDPAAVSPQIAQFIQLAVDYTETFLGATPAALGDTKPENTSAILALQRASATPNELTRQNMLACIEELGRIWMDFMANYYGVRPVELPVPRELAAFAGVPAGETAPQDFDFSLLKDSPMALKLDVGASAYWSEIASMQTLDNLLAKGKISLEDYLERIPDGYIAGRKELLAKLKTAQAPSGMLNE